MRLPAAAPAAPATLREDRKVAALQHVLLRAGWDLKAIEIDLVAGHARIEVAGLNGRYLIFDADRHDRASLTVESHGFDQVKVGRRGDVSIVSRWKCELLWRHKYPGVRSGLRLLCNYLEDNAPVSGVLSRYDVRRLVVSIVTLPEAAG